MRNFNRNTVAHMPRESTALLPTSQPDIFHKYISVLVSKGADGYGFVLRGAKGESLHSGIPPLVCSWRQRRVVFTGFALIEGLCTLVGSLD